MAKSPRYHEQHVAVFGESGSGKTVLLSSFYGRTQESSFTNDLWRLVPRDTGQGNRLYQNFLGMRDRSVAPSATRFSPTTYQFSVQFKSPPLLGRANAKPTLDALRLSWHDYPGEWFQESPSSREEEARRLDTFRALLGSDVALLLVDGQKLKDYEGEEEKYLKSMLTNINNGLLHLKDGLLESGEPLVNFPRIWILALSKADLLPTWDVDTFRDRVVLAASQHIEQLRDTIGELVVQPEALSLGEDFMLLSSAKFIQKPGTDDPPIIDVTKRVGVELILPVASILPLERRVQWAERLKLPLAMMAKLLRNGDRITAAMTGKRFASVQARLARTPRIGKFAAGLPAALIALNDMVVPQLEQLEAEARLERDYARATLLQFKADLERGVESKLLRKQP